jgi:hypothetical protein
MTEYTPSTKSKGIVFNKDGTATVVMGSMLTGITHEATLKLTAEQFAKWKVKGMLIQDALPHLTLTEREFLMTGSTPEEWGEAWKEDDDRSEGD